MPNQLNPPRIVDVGARFGAHPSLRCYESIAEFHLIEPDPDEVARLAELYKAAEHIQVHSLALSDQPGQLTLKLRRHRAAQKNRTGRRHTARYCQVNKIFELRAGQ